METTTDVLLSLIELWDKGYQPEELREIVSRARNVLIGEILYRDFLNHSVYGKCHETDY